jgi:hypothetical protein
MILRRILCIALAATLLTACASPPTPLPAPPPPAASAKPPRDEITAATIEHALAGDHRSASRPEVYGKITITRLGPGDFNKR